MPLLHIRLLRFPVASSFLAPNTFLKLFSSCTLNLWPSSGLRDQEQAEL